MNIPVVKNPRRRRRPRLSAKQLAAGFGGRRGMSRRRPARRRTARATRRRPRRNPVMATLGAANPRGRRRRSSSYAPARRYRRRAYRNPSLLGIDFSSALWVFGGALSTRLIPGLVGKAWAGMPRVGWSYTGIKLGSGLALGYVVKKFLKKPAAGNQIMIGATAMVMLDLYNEFLAPKLGLYGLGDAGAYVTGREIADVVAGRNLSGYRFRLASAGPSMMDAAA